MTTSLHIFDIILLSAFLILSGYAMYLVSKRPPEEIENFVIGKIPERDEPVNSDAPSVDMSMKKSELLDVAKAVGAKVSTQMKKQEIIDKINEVNK